MLEGRVSTVYFLVQGLSQVAIDGTVYEKMNFTFINFMAKSAMPQAWLVDPLMPSHLNS